MLALRLLSEGGEGPNTELLWLLLILLGFFALAVITGWISALGKPEQAEASTDAVQSLAQEEEAADSSKKETESARVVRKKKH